MARRVLASMQQNAASVKRAGRGGVQCGMSNCRKILLAAACLLGAGVSATRLCAPAYAGDFATYAEDEDACRHAGAAAIQGASGPAAAQRYDIAHGRCMVAHGRMRQMGDARDDAPPGGPAYPNVHSFGYPDAFYSVPYATPGYGYDGFSY